MEIQYQRATSTAWLKILQPTQIVHCSYNGQSLIHLLHVGG